MPSVAGGGRPLTRMLAELVIIVVGVLIALAADRWNQGRAERATEAAYLTRFSDEVRGDSSLAAAYLEERPAIVAALDSLIAFVDGAEAPPNLVATVLAVSSEFSLPQPVAWSEIQATNSLHVIQDPAVRAALRTYYSSRERLQLLWRRQDGRARDPFWDQLYGTGLFDPRSEFGVSPQHGVEAFRSWPDMRRYLVALGAGHYFQRQNADRLLREVNAALTVLRLRS